MLRWLILRNFKAFAGEHRIRLAPLTLIFGKNSAGKSSIIQSILFLSQSAGPLAQGEEARWGGNRVDLGSLEHVLYMQGQNQLHTKLTVGVIAELLEGNRQVPGGRKMHTIGFEWSWELGATTRDADNGPISGTWSEYIGDIGGVEYPIITAELRPYQVNQVDTSINEFIDGSAWTDATRRATVKFPQITRIKHRDFVTGGAKPINKKHPMIVQFYEMYAEPLATAFRNNLFAWSELVKTSHINSADQELIDLIIKIWKADNHHGHIISLKYISLGVLNTVSSITDEPHSGSRGLSTLRHWLTTHKSEGNCDFYQVKQEDYVELHHVIRNFAEKILKLSLEDFLHEVAWYAAEAGKDFEYSDERFGFHRRVINGEEIIDLIQPASDVIKEASRKYRLLGIAESDKSISWYNSNIQQIIYNIHSWRGIADHITNDRLVRELAKARHVKGLRPQLRRTYAGLAQGADISSDSSDETRALAARIHRSRSLSDQINMYLKVVNLPYVFEVHRSISPIFPVENHSFYLRDTRNNALLGMQDVGFGVGQLIPVIAELASVDGGILLLEQPELHLHPKMQAELGQLLANAVQQREGFQIIAETHSEHVVLRLMRLVREGKLPHDLVQILYVDQDDEGKSSAIELPIDEFGEFTEDWPGGFFEERMNEI